MMCWLVLKIGVKWNNLHLWRTDMHSVRFSHATSLKVLCSQGTRLLMIGREHLDQINGQQQQFQVRKDVLDLRDRALARTSRVWLFARGHYCDSVDYTDTLELLSISSILRAFAAIILHMVKIHTKRLSLHHVQNAFFSSFFPFSSVLVLLTYITTSLHRFRC